MSYLRHNDINVVRTQAYAEPAFKVMTHPVGGLGYAVFNDRWAREEYLNRFPHYFYDCRVVSYGGRLNAFELGTIH